jgi:hypothetical protein
MSDVKLREALERALVSAKVLRGYGLTSDARAVEELAALLAQGRDEVVELRMRASPFSPLRAALEIASSLAQLAELDAAGQLSTERLPLAVAHIGQNAQLIQQWAKEQES